MSDALGEIRMAARRLLLSPGYTVIAVAVLAIGIGANTTIFSLFNALLLEPLPGARPERLATVYTSDFSGPPYGTTSYPDYLDFRQQNNVFEDLAAYSVQPYLLSARGTGQRVVAAELSENFFEVLQLKPALGRFFGRSEEASANPPAVLGHGLWQRTWGGDPGVAGQTLELNGRTLVIVGVAPAGFNGPVRGLSLDLFVPLEARPLLAGDPEALAGRGNRDLALVGRLRPGVNASTAEAAFTVISARLHEAYPDEWTDRSGEARVVTVLPESESRVPPSLRGPISLFMTTLLVAVGLLLLIACADVANLQLVRAARRRREMAVRLVLGAGRWQLARQVLLESLLLALLAGAAGILLAVWASRLIVSFRPPLPFTLALDLELDGRVLAFTLGVSVLTALLFGLLPALRSAAWRQVGALRGDEEPGGHRLRKSLVVVQVTVCVVLLVSAGLFLRSLASAQAIDPGFSPEGVTAFSLDLEAAGYDAPRGRALYRQLEEQLAGLPGVEGVALARLLPLGTRYARRAVSDIEGYQPQPGEDMELNFNTVGPGYFEVMRVPIAGGRVFSAEDSEGAVPVAIVNEAFVRRYWPGETGLGRHLTVPRRVGGEFQPVSLQVVGVTRDGKYRSLGEEPLPFVFYPHRQQYSPSMTVLVRAAGDPAELPAALRERVRQLDARLVPYDFRTLDQHLGISLLPVRMAGTLVGVMGLLALLLATLGLYGVVAYVVSGRQREIGIRMALGAAPARVLRLISGQGLALTLLGCVLGLAAAAAVSRFLEFLLYGISPLDPWTYAGITLLLVATSALACWFPARRAARVDPARALRQP